MPTTHGISPEDRRTTFPSYHFAPIPTQSIPLPLTGLTIRSLLSQFGPLYVVARTSLFGEPSNHALVLSGVSNPGADEPTIWVHDSSSSEDSNPREWPLDYLTLLLNVEQDHWPDTNDSGLWRYNGPNARSHNQ